MSDSIGWFVPLDEITPHPENPRVNAHAVAEVAASIKRFGFSSPIVCRKADGVIIAGHTRYLAAQAIGLDKVPVRFLDLDPVNARLLMLADNRLGEKAFWDEGRLSAILNELRDEDLTGLGWNEDEISSLMMEKEHGENDPYEEWTGMPEYISDDLTSFKKLIIHFECQEDVDAFAALVGQTLTEKTKSIWYPIQAQLESDSERY